MVFRMVIEITWMLTPTKYLTKRLLTDFNALLAFCSYFSGNRAITMLSNIFCSFRKKNVMKRTIRIPIKVFNNRVATDANTDARVDVVNTFLISSKIMFSTLKS
ncbi:hypothetical protein SDC9_203260 [bioreactor metagenome]|uniref:Uncharacterized protein n=1 Tax=bioreactor metagenome TaxID=1076179 RepID=A0A645IWK7_9ZZZZ